MKDQMELLELDKVLALVANETATKGGALLVQALRPDTEFITVNRALTDSEHALELLHRYGTPPIPAIGDPCQAVKRAQAGGCLGTLELLRVSELLRAVSALARYGRGVESNPLEEDFSFLHPDDGLEEEISTCILGEDQIADNASSTLADIRRKIRQAGSQARTLLENLIHSPNTAKYLQEAIITFRDGRYVVPVKAEHRTEIKGLVHDTSGTGATVFIEPMGVVEANNKIRLLEADEKEEIRRILEGFSAEVGMRADSLIFGYKQVCRLDCLFAKARYADHTDSHKPILNTDGRIHLTQARHPLIDKKKAVPIDIWLGEKFDTLVITGPNTGGKTVSLKTLGLLTQMAMCGLLVPCREGSELSLFERILADIGDEQSIAQSLSTFSAHMTHIVEILEQADARSLVLLDELGSGTDPVEGAALAVSIIEALRDRGARVAATTHYAELKMFALETPGVENACCEFDVATLSPTYRLLIGVPGRSNAFAISQKLGLPGAIVQRAKDRMTSENTRFEDVVTSLEIARQQAEQERRETERLRDEANILRNRTAAQQKEIAAAKETEVEKGRQQAKILVDKVRAQGQAMIDAMEALAKEQDEATRAQRITQARQMLKAQSKELSDLADPVTKKAKTIYKLPRALKKGDEVILADLGSRAVVLDLPDAKGMVYLQAGLMKTKVSVDNLRLCEEKKIRVQGATGRHTGTTAAASGEIKLIGMNVEEALLELDRYLDQASRSHIPTVRIVHGKGTGTLRRAVSSHLKGHKQVKSFRLGVYGEGEDGVTIAEMK